MNTKLIFQPRAIWFHNVFDHFLRSYAWILKLNFKEVKVYKCILENNIMLKFSLMKKINVMTFYIVDLSDIILQPDHN